MHIQMTAHQCDLDAELRARATELAERWPRFESAISGARIVFEVEGRTHRVEAIVSRDHQEPVVASGTGDDFRAALDQLNERVTRIIRKHHARRVDHHSGPNTEATG